MSRVVTIVQARMGSSRLPGKVLMPIGQQSALYWVVYRILRTRLHGTIVIATSDQPKDDPIEAWCEEMGLICFRGSEIDVLDRYYQCSRAHDAEVVMRVTADSPLLDPELFDKVIAKHVEEDADYVWLAHAPQGIAQETISREALERAWREAVLPAEREHVIYYVTNRPKEFKVLMLAPPAELHLAEWRLTLDTAQDYYLISRLFDITCSKVADMSVAEIVGLVRRYPDLLTIANGEKS